MKKNLKNTHLCTKKKSKNLPRSSEGQDSQKNTNKQEEKFYKSLNLSKSDLISKLETDLSVANIEKNFQKSLSIQKLIAYLKKR